MKYQIKFMVVGDKETRIETVEAESDYAAKMQIKLQYGSSSSYSPSQHVEIFTCELVNS